MHHACVTQVEEAHALSQRVISFLEAGGGSADSQGLIGHFAPSLSAAQAPLFRQLLQQVARLRRSPTEARAQVLGAASRVCKRHRPVTAVCQCACCSSASQ